MEKCDNASVGNVIMGPWICRTRFGTRMSKLATYRARFGTYRTEI